jgi:hypothetical protein
LAIRNLTHAEALELLILLRRLQLYRISGIDARVVEDAMASMSRLELDSKK